MNTLKKIQKVADDLNAGRQLVGVFLYKFEWASVTEERQVFTDTRNPRLIGSIGRVGGKGPFVPFEHLENGLLVDSL